MEQQYDYTQRQALLSPPDVRDYKGVACVTEQQLPKTFELTKRGDIKSQGSTGSCVAHALAAVAEYFNIQETGKYEAMSTGYIYGNRRNTTWKGVGMYVNTALASLRHYGTTKASDWNNNNEVPKAIELFEADCAKYQQQAYENRITQYYRLYDVASMKAALYQGHPIVFVLVFRTGMEIKDGVWLVDEKSAKTGGSHCMWIYGWDERGWKVANSWSRNWGVNGTVILPFETKLSEVWGVCDTYNSEKLNSEIILLKNTLINLRKELNGFYITDGPTLTEEHKKKVQQIETKMNAIEAKIKQLQDGYLQVKKPFKNVDWLATALNAIIQLFWNLFNKNK